MVQTTAQLNCDETAHTHYGQS